MPRSGGASKTGDQSAQQSSERVSSPDDGRRSDDEDSETDILETSDNGRYQKMNEQVHTQYDDNVFLELHRIM